MWDDYDTAGAGEDQVLVIRNGASHRTADELAALFVSDVSGLAEDYYGAETLTLQRLDHIVARAQHAVDAEDSETLDDLVHIAESVLWDVSSGSAYVDWCDGYVIYSGLDK